MEYKQGPRPNYTVGPSQLELHVVAVVLHGPQSQVCRQGVSLPGMAQRIWRQLGISLQQIVGLHVGCRILGKFKVSRVRLLSG